jgi:Zn ribbon nucleic-acid-binding protein
MQCPRCNIDMVKGTAIKSNEVRGAIYISSPPLVNADTLQLIECWKCPQCGHSDDGTSKSCAHTYEFVGVGQGKYDNYKCTKCGHEMSKRWDNEYGYR